MEEIRELLYELIKTNFSSGVMVEHLAKIYKESYETRGLGPPLPSNWLDHVRVAEEFEVVIRGPIVMMKSVLSFEPIVCPSTVSVVVMKCDENSSDIFIQLAGTRNNFELLRSAMDSHYEEQSLGEPVAEPEIGGVYAVRDADGHWYRALLKVAESFILLDNGRVVPVKDATVRRLRAEYALPRIYPIYAFILRFISEYIENGLTKYIVQSSSIWIKDRKEQEQNVIKVMPVSPQYSVPPAGGVELVAMELSDMPKKRFAAHILAVFDADNISLRQRSLDPIPDYIVGAVKRDSLTQSSPPPFSELVPGRFYAAKLHPDSNWERVQLLGPSTVDADCFRVYAVDIGLYGIARKPNIRHLKIPNGLRKILMAKCK
ncbi:unnamed protein product, partial [Gongylonema pulchrum]|uniref:Tudor domain-containing protein n=1 Tax=Gongylonema pulchrum TaxID=637853 RepID=A0A183DX87_9BILA